MDVKFVNESGSGVSLILFIELSDSEKPGNYVDAPQTQMIFPNKTP